MTENLRYQTSSKPTGFSKQTYDQLKQQVIHLKTTQKEIQKTKAKEKELESVALLQQKQQYEVQLSDQQQEVSQLQQRLRDSVDRATKVRQHYERDKKALTQQIGKLEASLHSQTQQHQEELANQNAEHAQQLGELQDKLAACEKAREHDKQLLEAAKHDFLREVEDWSQGEVEAIQATAQQQVTAAREEMKHWQEEYEALKVKLCAEQEAAATGRHEKEDQLQQLKQDNADLQLGMQQLEVKLQSSLGQIALMQQAAATDARQWQDKMEVLQKQHDVQLRDLKVRHGLEMDQIQVKLQGVLQKKDATISGLRAELQAVAHKLSQTEQLLQEQLEDMRDGML
eukprot:jgi/Chrzof1/8910/Cz03g28240.t1